MGHMQCVSQTPETNPESPRVPGQGRVPGGSRRHSSRPLDVSMILPNLIPGKSLAPIRLKDQSLELQRAGSDVDAPQVERALGHLEKSGWYWGSITAAEAKQLLSQAEEGTFLLRDSSNPGYLLTLSVRTSLGPTHLRIESSGGSFGFDSLAMARPRLRCFGGAVELVEHYALACSHSSAAGSQDRTKPVGEEEVEAPDRSLQLKLVRPLLRAVPSLQHLCRIAINQHSRTPHNLSLPGRLKDFLLEYPFLL